MYMEMFPRSKTFPLQGRRRRVRGYFADLGIDNGGWFYYIFSVTPLQWRIRSEGRAKEFSTPCPLAVLKYGRIPVGPVVEMASKKMSRRTTIRRRGFSSSALL